MIDFWGVGYQVATRMGIEDAIRAAGYQIERVRSVGSRGQIKADIDVEAFRQVLGNDLTSLPAATSPERSIPPSKTRSKRSSATASPRSTSTPTVCG